MRSLKNFLLMALMVLANALNPASAVDYPDHHPHEQLVPERTNVLMIAVQTVQGSEVVPVGERFSFSQLILSNMADEKSKAAEVVTPPPASTKEKFKVVGLVAGADKRIPIRFRGRDYDLARLTAEQAEFLIKEGCPYVVKG